VVEGGEVRTFKVTLSYEGQPAAAPAAAAPATGGNNAVPLKAPFPGTVMLKDLLVKEGDAIKSGQVVAVVEAMKADHDVKAPCDGRIAGLAIAIGSEVPAGQPILTIAK
jgi:biotin carboxyl carrier protein